MLTDLGKRLLPWLDEEVMPVALSFVDNFWDYVRAWRELLEV